MWPFKQIKEYFTPYIEKDEIPKWFLWPRKIPGIIKYPLLIICFLHANLYGFGVFSWLIASLSEAVQYLKFCYLHANLFGIGTFYFFIASFSETFQCLKFLLLYATLTATLFIIIIWISFADKRIGKRIMGFEL